MKALWQPPVGRFTIVDVPKMQFVMVDGKGDPNVSEDYKAAVQWLYGVSYALKFASRRELGRDYTVAPLEGLWWADDMAAFVRRDKAAWSWTMLIALPDWITGDAVETARTGARKKKGLPAIDAVTVRTLTEGRSVQILHIGSYDDEGPVLDRLHRTYLPENGLAVNGHHHEIYLSDARRTEPAKLKTILRQPVKPA